MEQITREDLYTKISRMVTDIRVFTLDGKLSEAWEINKDLLRAVDSLQDNVEQLKSQLKALQDKELTFCEVETAKLKAELATYKDNVVYEVNGILDNYYIEADDGISMKAPYSVYKNFEENSMFKVIILKEPK